jgi:hypothetical protein
MTNFRHRAGYLAGLIARSFSNDQFTNNRTEVQRMVDLMMKANELQLIIIKLMMDVLSEAFPDE